MRSINILEHSIFTGDESSKKDLSLQEMIELMTHIKGIRINDEIAFSIDEITKSIIQKKAKINLNVQDKEGINILMAFTETQERDIETNTVVSCMKKLISAGASLDIKNKNGHNVLDHILVKYKTIHFFAHLDGWYKFFNEPKYQGKKTLEIESLKHLLVMAAVLLDAGVPLNPSVLSYNVNHKDIFPTFNLVNGTKLSEYNLLFLFLRDLSKVLTMPDLIFDKAYSIIYSEIENLVSNLSTKTNFPHDENPLDTTTKSYAVLHEETCALLKSLAHPSSIKKIKIDSNDVLQPVDCKEINDTNQKMNPYSFWLKTSAAIVATVTIGYEIYKKCK